MACPCLSLFLKEAELLGMGGQCRAGLSCACGVVSVEGWGTWAEPTASGSLDHSLPGPPTPSHTPSIPTRLSKGARAGSRLPQVAEEPHPELLYSQMPV